MSDNPQFKIIAAISRGFIMADNFSLMIHGGAGSFRKFSDQEKQVFLAAMNRILKGGRDQLRRGASAIQAVEHCVCALEDDALFNAGRGSVLNEHRQVEMDAAIMSGVELRAGAVAGVQYVKNPVSLALRISQQSEHVMFVGEGAMNFADQCGVEQMPEEYFISEALLDQLDRAIAAGKMTLDHDAPEHAGTEQVGTEHSELEKGDNKLGTVGAVAWDTHGDLAAATSTGGMVNKRHGRVGDSPLIGAGCYADNETCAVSTTGYGEDFIRTVLAKTIADLIEMKGLDASTAAQQGIEYLVRKVKGRGGFIMIDRLGTCASRFTTPCLLRGWVEKGGESQCSF